MQNIEHMAIDIMTTKEGRKVAFVFIFRKDRKGNLHTTKSYYCHDMKHLDIFDA